LGAAHLAAPVGTSDQGGEGGFSAPEHVLDVGEPEGLFHVPYPAAERCTAAAGALTRADAGGEPGEYAELVVSPGVIALRTFDEARPWEAPHRRAQRHARCNRRGVIQAWSPRSRKRMVRALAECSWSGSGWGMVTLTYPGDWLTCAPSPEVAHAHLAALRRRWERRFGPAEGCWKLEFQRRGAPHFHLLLRIPPLALPAIRSWVARQWYEIVNSGDERHLRAGTSVDVSWRGWEGAAAIARYFAKHGLWSTKEYQHDVPEAWDTTGRWWGLWNLERVREVVQLDHDAVVVARRLLRKWYRSRHPARLVVHAVEVHGGVPVLRTGHRGGRLRSLSGDLGAFVLCRDGPVLALSLGRALGLWEGGEPPWETPDTIEVRAAGATPPSECRRNARS